MASSPNLPWWYSSTALAAPWRGCPREREVPEQMAQGRNNTAIVERLSVSLSALEKHVDAVFDKLDPGRADGCSRRVTTVPRYLGLWEVPGATSPDS